MAASESLALISSYRSARSRSARLPCRPDLSFPRVLQPLTDAFFCVGAGGNVEQALISSGVLHDGFCLPLHGKHHRALALLELLHEVARTPAEGGQRLDVLRDVKHGSSH